MNIDTKELAFMTTKLEGYASQISSLKTRLELEPQLALKDEEITQLKMLLKDSEEKRLKLETKLAVSESRCEELQQQMNKTLVENAWLKNCILLSVSRIKNFMHLIKRVELKSLLLTFLQKTLSPDMGPQGLEIINEAVELNDEDEIRKLADQIILENNGNITHQS